MLHTILTLTALSLASRAIWLHRRLAAYELVHQQSQGWVRVELRRKAELATDNAHAFPLPRETRVLTTRVAGIPVWRTERAVGLPLSAADNTDSLCAQSFDELFPADFRAAHGQRP